MPLYKVTCMPRGHALGVVSISTPLSLAVAEAHDQTYQAPVDDRSSVTFTEFIASMDVAMGGRAAEELSKLLLYHRRTYSQKRIVYGKENITSGASSDLENATHTARTMIRVRSFLQKKSRGSKFSIELGLF